MNNIAEIREALAETTNGQTDAQFWRFWISGPGVTIIRAARDYVDLLETKPVTKAVLAWIEEPYVADTGEVVPGSILVVDP